MAEAREPPPKRPKAASEDYASDEWSTEGGAGLQPDLDKLREFRVLDEVGVESGDSDQNDSDNSLDLPDEEIEKMLEEGLPEDYRGPPKEKEKPYITWNKLVVEEKGVNQFEVLPVDWLMVIHNSGMPVYLHRTTRVCTLSKPYFLGPGSVKKHEIPISAIPCLAYRRALEEEEREKKIQAKIEQQMKDGTFFQNYPQPGCPASNKNKVNNPAKKQNTEVITSNGNSINAEANSDGDATVTSKQNDTNSDSNEPPLDISKSYCDMNGEAFNDNNKKQVDVKNTSKRIENKDTNSEKETISKDANTRTEKENSQMEKVAPDSSTDAIKTDIDDIEIPAHMRPVVLPGGIVLPPAKIETMQDSLKKQYLPHKQVTDYCKSLFKFKTVKIVHFKNWNDHRRYAKAKKAMQPPTLPKGTKVIKIPSYNSTEEDNKPTGILGRSKRSQQDFVVNMNGRSYVSVFHEYVRRTMQKQPDYEFRHIENAATPYEATVLIDGMRYGVGVGSSKRIAKLTAARESMLILMPEMKEQMSQDEHGGRITGDEADLEFFDTVGIEDPRVIRFCATTMEPSPHAILRICLLRNFATSDRNINCEIRNLKDQDIEFKMTVGKHTATVVCKNKKTGKQRASQAILQKLHPHVKSWGSLLRLYGSRSVKSYRVRKQEEQEITLLQDQAAAHRPNHAILDKLRREIRRLHEADAAVVPIGTLTVQDQLPTLSGSRLNNVEM